MQQLKTKLISLVVLVELLLGWLGWALLRSLYPQDYFVWYPGIPIIFLVMGAGTTMLLARSYKKEAKKVLNLYMILKLIKLIVAIGCVLIYFFAFKDNLRIFGLVFAVFYATYIGLETYILYSIEKLIKKES